MRKLDSQHFPKLYAYFENSKELVLVQEYVQGRSIMQLIKALGNKKGLNEQNVRNYAKQLAEALR